MVSQKMRQASRQKTDSNFISRSAVRSQEASARQPDLRILWKTSIFQRNAYHTNFSIASARERTGRSVINFRSIFSRSVGVPRSSRIEHRQRPFGVVLLLARGAAGGEGGGSAGPA